MQATLALEDGKVFRGKGFGARAEQSGEVIFNTAMTGYQEVLSDPSYHGQIVVMTCPEIGNYGTNGADAESSRPQLGGFVVREICALPSSWRAEQPLPDHLEQHGIPGISGVDTRELTRHLRSQGAMIGVLSTIDHDADALVGKARSAPRLEERDLVADVSCPREYTWSEGRPAPWATESSGALAARLHCVAYDFGIKQNILRLMWEAGFGVTVVPASTDAEKVLAMKPDAVFLSNGPGDPSVPTYAIDAVRKLIGRLPVFGICLGHQICALALGGRTLKLKFGHHGANHPVHDLRSGRVEVTSQNHGFTVDPDSLPPGVEVTHVNLNDGTCEGFAVPDSRLLAVQYHPESSPGPHDAHHLFREFRRLAGDGALEGTP